MAVGRAEALRPSIPYGIVGEAFIKQCRIPTGCCFQGVGMRGTWPVGALKAEEHSRIVPARYSVGIGCINPSELLGRIGA